MFFIFYIIFVADLLIFCVSESVKFLCTALTCLVYIIRKLGIPTGYPCFF